jgi:hypothetical protein
MTAFGRKRSIQPSGKRTIAFGNGPSPAYRSTLARMIEFPPVS